MGKVTLFHGTSTWFERPDMDLAGMGDGRSMAGLGFNMADSAAYCREHLGMRGASPDAVIFQTEVEAECLADWGKRLDPGILDRATTRAAELGMERLAGDLGRLRGALTEGSSFVLKGYYASGADRREDPSLASNSLVRDMVGRALPDQRLWNEFMLGMGVRVQRTGNVWVAIDADAVGPLRVAEVLGQGPAGMPPGIGPGDLAETPSSRAGADRLEAGDLRSDELRRAWDIVRESGDARLEVAFRNLAKVLVSDRFLPPSDPSGGRTAAQNNGFDIRNSVGLAIRDALAPWQNEAGIAAAPTRLAERLGRAAEYARDRVGDPVLDTLIANLSSAAGHHAARAARRLTAPLLAADTLMGEAKRSGAAIIHSPLALAHEALGRAASYEVSGDLPAGTVSRLASKMDEAFRRAEAATDRATQDRVAFPLAAEISKALGGHDRLRDVQHAVVHALRAFAPRPRPPVATEVEPSSLLEAAAGQFRLPQDRDLPISGHPGWTVLQRGGSQLIKLGGKLMSFCESGFSIPALVRADGTGLDVVLDGGEPVRRPLPQGWGAASHGHAPR